MKCAKGVTKPKNESEKGSFSTTNSRREPYEVLTKIVSKGEGKRGQVVDRSGNFDIR